MRRLHTVDNKLFLKKRQKKRINETVYPFIFIKWHSFMLPLL